MLLAINGATTMKATLPEDIVAAGAAGFKGVEIWAAKMNAYLETNSQYVGEVPQAPPQTSL